VGDRYDVDIAPALELGMGGILVEGVEEVYSLKGFLNGEASP
jgi:phosphoglycolate phosphatase/putative hydrolase of the HAD superfamily